MRDGVFIVWFQRVLGGAMLLLACAAAWGRPPSLSIDPALHRINLAEKMEAFRLPAALPRDPDTLWRTDGGQLRLDAVPRWRLGSQYRVVGRITLSAPQRAGTYVVHLPVPLVDEVEVFHRQGSQGAWQSARAGDRVALSQWPFATQFPAFPLEVRSEPLDLIVVAGNSATLQVPVMLFPDAEFREDAARRANVSGIIVGLGLMVTVICLLGAWNTRSRAGWLLVVVSAWTLLAISCANGYVAVWFTPEAPGFNDGSKHFTAMILAALMVSLVAESLDLRYVSRFALPIALCIPAAALVYAMAQAAWLPLAWRVHGALVWSSFTLLCCMVLCALSAIQGGRHVRPVAIGVACLVGAMLLPMVPPDLVPVLDLRSAGLAILLYAALLLFRQALMAREQYGRDVLGRAAVSANRDPLTALLSLSGFELAYDKALLRQGAGAGVSSVMLCVLPGLERSAARHGFVISDRALVRFAAALQAALGDAWSIARLSKNRFACISTQPQGNEQLVRQATQVLARCARVTQPLAPVEDFGLRIACVRRRLDSDGLKGLLLEMEDAAMAMAEGKRIAML